MLQLAPTPLRLAIMPKFPSQPPYLCLHPLSDPYSTPLSRKSLLWQCPARITINALSVFQPPFFKSFYQSHSLIKTLLINNEKKREKGENSVQISSTSLSSSSFNLKYNKKPTLHSPIGTTRSSSQTMRKRPHEKKRNGNSP